MRAVRFADECSKWKTPAQTFSSSGALRCARTQTRFAARTAGGRRSENRGQSSANRQFLFL